MMGSDRRHLPRQKEEATIVVLLSTDDSEDIKKDCNVILAKMGNQSKQGLYFEIDRNLKHGSTISIRMAVPDAQHPEAPYFVRDGQVVWSRKIDDKTPRFGVGVKILRRVVQADVLNSRFG
jgi:hypothetical protein